MKLTEYGSFYKTISEAEVNGLQIRLEENGDIYLKKRHALQSDAYVLNDDGVIAILADMIKKREKLNTGSCSVEP